MELLSQSTDIAGLKLKDHLDVSWLNHQAIANNLANAETPGFQGSHVAYREAIAWPEPIELARTNAAHFPESQLPLTAHASVQASGPVNLDSEMAEMTKNNLFYQTLVEAVTRRDHLARTAIEAK